MDCLEGLRRMPDNSVDLILTDPPYFFDTKKGKGTGIVKDSKYLKEIEYMTNGFDLRILDECVRVMKKINAFSSAPVNKYQCTLNIFLHLVQTYSF